MPDPKILRVTALGLRLCVPKAWSDEQIEKFAETKRPCGTTHGWKIQKQGQEGLLGGDDARITCVEDVEAVHVVVGC